MESSTAEMDNGALVEGKLNKIALAAWRGNPVLSWSASATALPARVMEGIVLFCSSQGLPHLKCWGFLFWQFWVSKHKEIIRGKGALQGW